MSQHSVRATRTHRLRWPLNLLLLGFTLACPFLWVDRPTQQLPQRIDVGNDAQRFGVAKERRQEIFTALSQYAPTARATAKRNFPTHRWSQEDDYHNMMRQKVHQLAARQRLHVAQVYLILDEGIRNHWPGVDGKPLSATTVPLNLRTQ